MPRPGRVGMTAKPGTGGGGATVANGPGADDTIDVAGAAGASANAARVDHGHQLHTSATAAVAVGTAAAGTSGHSPSRDDHVHPTGAGTPSTQVHGDTGVVGTGPAASMTDHKHVFANLTGDVTTTGSMVTAIAASAVTLAKMANIAAGTVLMNNTTAAAAPVAVVATLAPDDPVVTNALIGYLCDPILASTNVTPAAATIYLVKIPIPVSKTITNIIVIGTTAGTSYTNGQLGLYSSAGTFLSASVVQASASPNGFGVTGAIILPLSAAQAIVGGPTVFVWAAFHMGTNAVTAFIVRTPGASSASANVGLAASAYRCATQTGHATNPLATIGNLTPASNISAANAPWLGVS
jgi:hypothetical protein